MPFPKISIVTVVYNAVNVVADTIQSVAGQTYANKEYIVVDGNSTDGTLEVIKEYSASIDVLVSESDKGIYDAMNKGAKLATGEWILFMNAGDSFASNSVLSEVFLGKSDDNFSVIYGDTIAVYPWGKVLIKARTLSTFELRLPFCHQSVFVKTELMKRHQFDVSYRAASDYNFFYSLYKNNVCFTYVEIPISLYDVSGFSAQNAISTYKEIASINKSVGTTSYYNMLFVLYVRAFVLKLIPNRLEDMIRKKKLSRTYEVLPD